MSPPELRDLSDDIHANGLRETVTLTPNGELLDGRKIRSRMRASETAKKAEPLKAPIANPDAIGDAACSLITKVSDGAWRALPRMASIADVATSTAGDALKRLGPDCVETRKVGNGLEYRINGKGMLADKDTDLKSQLAAKDAEIADLRSQLAEKDSEIARLKAELLTTGKKASSPSKKKPTVSRGAAR
jgi:hypothetical protein